MQRGKEGRSNREKGEMAGGRKGWRDEETKGGKRRRKRTGKGAEWRNQNSEKVKRNSKVENN